MEVAVGLKPKPSPLSSAGGWLEFRVTKLNTWGREAPKLLPAGQRGRNTEVVVRFSSRLLHWKAGGSRP